MLLKTGSCLCGSINLEIKAAPQMMGNCYCVDCRKSSGTGHCTHAAYLARDVEINGELKYYSSPADSGNMINRGFCANCGSAVLSTNDAMAGMVFVRASCINEPEDLEAQMSVYASRAPAWDRPPENLPKFDEMPPQMPI